MSVEALKCPKCGGNISPNGEVCKYCGTYYVIKDEKVLNLHGMLATDENIEKYVRLSYLQYIHHVRQMHSMKPAFSEEEFSSIIYTARDDLREELQREPTINEIDQRSGSYFRFKGTTKIMNFTLMYFLIFAILMIVFLFILFFIIFK